MLGHLLAVNPGIPVDVSSITVRAFQPEKTRSSQEPTQMVREQSHAA